MNAFSACIPNARKALIRTQCNRQWTEIVDVITINTFNVAT